MPWRIDAIAEREELIDLLWGIELGQQLPVGQCCDDKAAAVPPWRGPEVEASAKEEDDDAWGEWKGKQSSASLGSNLGGTMAKEEVPDSDEDNCDPVLNAAPLEESATAGIELSDHHILALHSVRSTTFQLCVRHAMKRFPPSISRINISKGTRVHHLDQTMMS